MHIFKRPCLSSEKNISKLNFFKLYIESLNEYSLLDLLASFEGKIIPWVSCQTFFPLFSFLHPKCKINAEHVFIIRSIIEYLQYCNIECSYKRFYENWRNMYEFVWIIFSFRVSVILGKINILVLLYCFATIQ